MPSVNQCMFLLHNDVILNEFVDGNTVLAKYIGKITKSVKNVQILKCKLHKHCQSIIKRQQHNCVCINHMFNEKLWEANSNTTVVFCITGVLGVLKSVEKCAALSLCRLIKLCEKKAGSVWRRQIDVHLIKLFTLTSVRTGGLDKAIPVKIWKSKTHRGLRYLQNMNLT